MRRLVRRVCHLLHQEQIHCWWYLWVCGRRRAFPCFPSWLGKRGKRSRSATPIVPISTGLSGKFAAECDTQALVLAFRVVKAQPAANAGLGFGHCRIGIEVDLLVFETAHSRSAKMLSMQRPLPSMLIV